MNAVPCTIHINICVMNMRWPGNIFFPSFLFLNKYLISYVYYHTLRATCSSHARSRINTSCDSHRSFLFSCNLSLFFSLAFVSAFIFKLCFSFYTIFFPLRQCFVCLFLLWFAESEIFPTEVSHIIAPNDISNKSEKNGK